MQLCQQENHNVVVDKGLKKSKYLAKIETILRQKPSEGWYWQS